MQKRLSPIVLLLCIVSMTTFAQTKTSTTAKAPAAVKTEVLTNKSVIDLTKAGLDEELIISKISSSTCKFDMSTDGLVSLKKEGVSAGVIRTMLDKSNGKVTTTTTPEPVKPVTETKPATPATKGGSVTVELMNHVYIMNKTDRSTKPLEKSVAGIRTKQGMFGGSSMLQVDGAKSPIRVSKDETASFVINTGGSSLPELVLYKLKSVKGHREVASMKVSTWKGVTTGEDVVTIDIAKLQEGIFQITPGKKLEPGEYFFTGKPVAGANSMDAFAFGVD